MPKRSDIKKVMVIGSGPIIIGQAAEFDYAGTQACLALKEEGNVLLLDEPTNDIDVNTLRALEEGLENFAGCAVVISHDRWFLDRIATHILSFEGDSKVLYYEGSYSEFEEWKKAQGLDTAPKRVKYKKLVE